MPNLALKSARSRLTAVSLVLITLALQACSDDETTDRGSALTPGGGAAGDPADDATDEVLLANAAASTGTLSKNLDILQRLSDDQPTGMTGLTEETPPLDETGDEVNGFLRSTLGIDQPGARTTREGNIITVDPDDADVCEQEVPLTGLDDQDLSLCQQLVADLVVTVNAQTEESGLITYLFQNEPVLLVGYAPDAANYEIKFPGVQRVLQRSDELRNNEQQATSTFAGSIRLGSVITNDQAGFEAGEFTVEVVDPIEIREIGGPSLLALGPSTVVAVSSDMADDSATLTVDWGALTFTSESGDSLGNRSLSTVALAGLTGSARVSESGPDLQIRNLGVGGVPVTITIDSVESVSLGLDDFGFDLDSESGQVTMTGALGVNLAVNNLMGVFDDAFEPEFMADLQLAMPAGTRLEEGDFGVLRVLDGGPVTSSLIASDNTESIQQEARIDVGSCFELGSSSDDDDISQPVGLTDELSDPDAENLQESIGEFVTPVECF